MVAHKRRRHASTEESTEPEGLATAASSPPSGKISAETLAVEDPTSQLVRLCVRVLKGISPRGLATKDLATALDAEKVNEPTYKSVSSSVLSSKLNALFRRFHGSDSTNAPTKAQLTDLPLTRRQSEDLPKRLVYVYSPPSSDDESDVESKPVVKIKEQDDDEIVEAVEEPLTPSRGDSEPEVDDNDAKAEPQPKRRRIDEPKVEELERPTTPTEQFDSKPSKGSTKKVQEPLPNLYYDTIGSSAITTALTDVDATMSPNADLLIEEYESPENLMLSELDSLVC